MDFRIERLISKIKSAKRRDVALFVGSFVLFFVLSSAAQVAMAPGVESSFDSSYIDNAETFAYSRSSKEIIAFDE
ncbi:MAG: hypothetical protein QMC36_08260, partial [Patescibacteria group bacterium]